ncbi:DUF6934 family protein [Emticicia sp.]|uniref:DUF6934 family protein n=1 Tax=Emticicia sp. TaxID=1930953 RepID=UPI003753516F
MEQPFYEFQILDDAFRYEFFSTGKGQTIKKIIIYKKTDSTQFYNLILADIMPDGSLSVTNVSNNDDMEAILATVAQTMLIFFEKYKRAIILFSGSTAARTRLYQIAISREFDKVSDILNIFGILGGEEAEPFQKNKNYIGFAISQKSKI